MIDLLEEYSVDELKLIDIQFLGLNQQPWDFIRGARTDRKYLYPNGDVAVKDSFTYTFDSGNRNVTTINRSVAWYDASGSQILTKNLPSNISDKKLKAVNREIRQGRLDYLESAGENLRDLAATVPDPYRSAYTTIADNIDALFIHYDSQVRHYIARDASMEFENAVNNETDAATLATLALASRPPDATFPNGLTVKQSILYQLTGVIP